MSRKYESKTVIHNPVMDYPHCTPWCLQKLLRQETSAQKEAFAANRDISEQATRFLSTACDHVEANSWAYHVPDFSVSIAGALLWSEVKWNLMELGKSMSTSVAFASAVLWVEMVSMKLWPQRAVLVYSHLNLYWEGHNSPTRLLHATRFWGRKRSRWLENEAQVDVTAHLPSWTP